ncbi:hypothetical protein CVT91_08120 [Candidatus Atribacteria bacterium HGW-Atribacteria-1]|nr:MAG: hypothetical protein CVT91_08120 [Candidatus Atribacteria bacterium HGW-Atribacteria-1]
MQWNNKKVLITGGCGFIGPKLAMKLLEKNADITILDNFSDINKINMNKIIEDCKIVKGNILDKKSLEKIDKNISYVFHFGAPSSIILFNKDPNLRVHETICGFLNIMGWVKEIGIDKLVYPSSGSVYGNVPPPQSENISPKPVNLYGICKLTTEHIAKNYSDYVPSVGLRIFAGYGPGEEHKGDYASVVTLFLESIIKGESPIIYGDGTQGRDFVYIDNVIDAIVASAEKNIKDEVINVGSGKRYSFNDIINIINHKLNKNIKPKYVNRPINYLENTLADITKMKKMLDIFPMDLEEGIEKYLEVKNIL